MSLYEIRTDQILPLADASFEAAGIRERGDLQRLLRTQIDVICPDTLLLAEEFGDWQDSRRRVDLLALDKSANLVVVELKRDETGGHMDLQAVRYAAMVAGMTFEKACRVLAEHRKQDVNGLEGAQAALLEFLGWDEPDEDVFAQNVRIVLASAEFSKELTTSVMWLNEQGLDIRCMRIKPYVLEGRLLMNVQQVLPLPEAEDYRVRLREKSERQRAGRERRDLTTYDLTIGTLRYGPLPKRLVMLTLIKHLCNCGVAPEAIASLVPWRQNTMFRSVEGEVASPEVASRIDASQTDIPRQLAAVRYFCAEGELIPHGGRTYVLTNRWGNRCIEAVQRISDAFPQHKIHCDRSIAADA